MKKLFCAALLASTLSVSAASAQDSSSAPTPQKDSAQAADKSAKPRPKSGTDCSPNRAGAKCNKPKQRKPWFFGKA